MDRKTAVPALIGDHHDFLIVTGLAGAARDVAALTDDGSHIYTMAGAMGGACMVGFGLALAQPDKRILVVTGDGELLMGLGSLTTIGIQQPANLAIVCVDNGLHGETGKQKTAAGSGVDLEQMAIAAGFKATRTVTEESEITDASKLLRQSNSAAFVLLKVSADDPPSYKRLMDPAACRVRFRGALLD